MAGCQTSCGSGKGTSMTIQKHPCLAHSAKSPQDASSRAPTWHINLANAMLLLAVRKPGNITNQKGMAEYVDGMTQCKHCSVGAAMAAERCPP